MSDKNIPFGSIIEADLEISLNGSSSGTDDYEVLKNKPKINGVELEGDLSTKDIGITPLIPDNNTTFIDPEGKLHAVLPVGERNIRGVIFNGVDYIADENYKVTLNEEDPTVGIWAKSVSKPSYTSDEVGAVGVNDSMTFEEIDLMFDAVFNNN